MTKSEFLIFSPKSTPPEHSSSWSMTSGRGARNSRETGCPRGAGNPVAACAPAVCTEAARSEAVRGLRRLVGAPAVFLRQSGRPKAPEWVGAAPSSRPGLGSLLPTPRTVLRGARHLALRAAQAPCPGRRGDRGAWRPAASAQARRAWPRGLAAPGALQRVGRARRGGRKRTPQRQRSRRARATVGGCQPEALELAMLAPPLIPGARLFVWLTWILC
ncbi:uncharacterized protein LOC116660609 [Camelus ferus]|uniref:Uncharacterized protein LOC116660609 n=1 Tax=Camelus ferus TaxID=419612 RepID=A0A8B8S981_CAMFR|nr:uncharacterized protein LOC116660609 [Camelus ferus]